ncbi:hypothetical protein GCM10010172_38960 [Paractinoplanes ferrugineus]|uniref:Uncharacterized protein n=1 Tax=Paractinoplanes ferrugineus TaxID=113564 RepID=A0A919J3E8_9ACTN|nr:hypothetical protein Afe05nite_45120 [Actinoplanes ferrugineus]
MSIILPALALIAAFGAFLWLGRTTDRIGEMEVAYVRSEANLRECPRLYCQISDTYRAGQQVIIERVVSGDRVDGSDEWLEIRYGSATRFVHRYVVEAPSTSLGNTVEALLSLLSLVVIVPLALLPRLQRRIVRENDEAATDGLLFGAVAAFGIATGTLGFVFSRSSGESLASFFAGTFVNLGSGLAGAAVAFVLFQSLLAKRAAGSRQVDALSAEIDRLRIDVLSQVGELRGEVGRIAASSAAHRPVLRKSPLSKLIARVRGAPSRPNR